MYFTSRRSSIMNRKNCRNNGFDEIECCNFRPMPRPNCCLEGPIGPQGPMGRPGPTGPTGDTGNGFYVMSEEDIEHLIQCLNIQILLSYICSFP